MLADYHGKWVPVDILSVTSSPMIHQQPKQQTEQKQTKIKW